MTLMHLVPLSIHPLNKKTLTYRSCKILYHPRCFGQRATHRDVNRLRTLNGANKAILIFFLRNKPLNCECLGMHLKTIIVKVIHGGLVHKT